MHTTTEFAHGIHYGDDLGITFYGPPNAGFWEESLAVSRHYIEPLFQAALDHFRQPSGLRDRPKLCSEWNTLSGWVEADGIQEISHADAAELVAALSALNESDFSSELTGAAAGKCLKCAVAICHFIQGRLDLGKPIFLEDG
jgi:hypothetical protein